jgi:hypothetical protein
MRFTRLKNAVLGLGLLVGAGLLVNTTAPAALAQSNISGDLAGTVIDPAGAAVVGATVTVTNSATGGANEVKTSGTGGYRISLLKPGTYSIKVAAVGFKDTTSTVTVGVAQVVTENISLTLGSETQTVEVAEGADLLQTENADVSTTITMDQTQNLPNPGNDITFYAQTVPGAVMNTQGGYGNFEVFGLPATSNNFTLNGGQEDDPFLNLNNSGPSNLLLGNNDIAQVNVITNAYSSEYGTFGGAQVLSISRSGGNKFHGNADYWYNGSVLNANNWFLNNEGAGRPGDVDNQWAAAVGGPIVKDKTFFFVDYEGIRFVTTNTSGVYVPSPSFEATTLANIAASPNPEVQSESQFYSKNLFGTYNNAPGANLAVATSDPDVDTFESATKLLLHEWFLAGRVDQNFGANDKAFFHFKVDKGVQPTYSDPFTTTFNANSVQPDYEAQLGLTHVFNSNMVNQFLVSGSYYGAIFAMADPAAAQALMPETLDFFDGSFTSLNADGYAFPQGRNVTQYQVQDDFSITKGRHTLKFGGFFKRDDVSDFDKQQFTTPLLLTEKNYFGTLQNGGAFEEYYNQNLLNPSAGDQPINLYVLGVYAEEQFKPTPNLQLNLGVRLERDSEPSSTQGNFVRLNGDFFPTATNFDTVNDPYSAFISPGHHAAFVKYTPLMAEPRFGFTWSPKENSSTVVRGGVGMFTDVFPGVIADSLLGNYPFSINVSTFPDSNFAGLGGKNAAVTTNLLQPGLPDSALTMAANTAAIFGSGFNSSYATLATSSPCPACVGADAGVAPPNFTNASNSISYPTYAEYSMQIEHQFKPGTSLMVGYVGNHGYHEPVQNENANAYDTNGFVGLPTARPAGGFSSMNEIDSTGASNYNGLIVALQHRSRILTLQANYTYSHTLDDVSNGGISPFSFGSGAISAQIDPYNLRYNYGNADYDSRHVINGDYVINIPHWRGPRLGVDGWTVSGTFFFNNGYPFTLVDSAATPIADGELFNTGLPAQVVPGTTGHRCGIDKANPGNICSAFASAFTAGDITPATGFGTQERNQYLGPHYFDTDFGVAKSFPLGNLEGASFKIGAQLFNILNHPNFTQPGADANSTSFGTITGMANPPTSIFGSFLGGDAAPRLVQFKGVITF